MGKRSVQGDIYLKDTNKEQTIKFGIQERATARFVGVDIEVLPNGKHPTKGHATDVGADLYTRESVLVMPGMYKSTMIPTGIKIAVAENIGIFVSPRSSISKLPLAMANSTGIIDPDYRGEIFLPLKNTLPASPNYNSYALECFVLGEGGKTLERMQVADLPKDLVDDAMDEYWEQLKVLAPNESFRGTSVLPTHTVYIPAGTRLAQLYAVERFEIRWDETDVNDDTVRGAGGFGSTGGN